MKIEIIRFYEAESATRNKSLIGTLHILLPEIGLNFKGINAYRNKNHWHFRMPARKTFDESLGKDVQYQYISFEDRNIDKTIIEFLHENAKGFIENYFLQKSTPIIEKLIGKEKICEKPKLIVKEFVDPPPLKSVIARSKSKFAKK